MSSSAVREGYAIAGMVGLIGFAIAIPQASPHGLCAGIACLVTHTAAIAAALIASLIAYAFGIMAATDGTATGDLATPYNVETFGIVAVASVLLSGDECVSGAVAYALAASAASWLAGIASARRRQPRMLRSAIRFAVTALVAAIATGARAWCALAVLTLLAIGE